MSSSAAFSPFLEAIALTGNFFPTSAPATVAQATSIEDREEENNNSKGTAAPELVAQRKFSEPSSLLAMAKQQLEEESQLEPMDTSEAAEADGEEFLSLREGSGVLPTGPRPDSEAIKAHLLLLEQHFSSPTLGVAEDNGNGAASAELKPLPPPPLLAPGEKEERPTKSYKVCVLSFRLHHINCCVFQDLIIDAIESSSEKRLKLSEIYQVRHFLSRSHSPNFCSSKLLQNPKIS